MTELPTLTLSALAYPTIDPVALSIGPLQIHWYGIGYVVGILFAWYYARWLISKERFWNGLNTGITGDHLDVFVVWATIGILLGGRIGYALFYNFDATLQNPLSLIAIWQGGMSFHGGFLGCTIAMIWFAKRYQVSILSLWDVVAAGVPVGLGLVRVANFINGELWGRVTDSPLGMVFPRGGPEPRHPSQLYEAALEGIVLFAFLFICITAFKALSRPGLISGLFVAGYGLSRIIVEFFREPDAHIGFLFGGWMTMGMVLSLPMVIAGAVLIIFSKQKAEKAA